MSVQWVKIYSSSVDYLVELIRGQLEEESIKTFVLNKQDSMHTHLSIGEIELYVEQDNVLRAKHLISKQEF